MSSGSSAMPFGKFRGKPIHLIPADYLHWLLDNVRLGAGFRREVAAELDRRDRDRARLAEELSAPLPVSIPRDVCGVWLGPIESALFEEAVRAGELVIGPDLPASSKLPAAWAAYCAAVRVPHLVRELTLADVGAEPPKGAS